MLIQIDGQRKAIELRRLIAEPGIIWIVWRRPALAPISADGWVGSLTLATATPA
jgi:hypothetical protein